jgi:hypothetical protein
MKFMCMHKVDAKMEAGTPPPPDLIQKIGQLVGRSLKAGVFKDGAGLHRSAQRARVRFEGDRASVERGPYAGGNELVASFALVSIGKAGIERAIELATDLGRAAGGREVEVGPVVEGWDLNGSTRPADAPHRFLLLVKANDAFEAGAPAPSDVSTLLDRWRSEGIVQTEGSLRPSKNAARSRVVGGKRQWIDGPFAESKELIAGYSILELDSLDDAKRFTEEFAAIIGDNEVDVREVV